MTKEENTTLAENMKKVDVKVNQEFITN